MLVAQKIEGYNQGISAVRVHWEDRHLTQMISMDVLFTSFHGGEWGGEGALAFNFRYNDGGGDAGTKEKIWQVQQAEKGHARNVFCFRRS